jgi:colicin import membrane protein
MFMAKQGKKDPLARAKRKVAKAQNRYMKTVAKGERQIRSVRAEVDESIARAKAEFEMRANQLAEIEQDIANKNAAAATAEEAANRVTAARQKPPAKKARAASAATPEEAASRIAKVQQAHPVKKAPAKATAAATAEEAADRVARAGQKRPAKKTPARTPAAAVKAVRSASAAAARPKPEVVASNGDGAKSGADILAENGTQSARKRTRSTPAPRTRRTGQGDTGGK